MIILALVISFFIFAQRVTAREEETDVTTIRLPRGLANNNPGNLKISGNQWRGKIPIDRNTDFVFEQFESVEWGIRAAIMTIGSYFESHGIDTIRGIVSRWAPRAENRTDKYIQYVTSCSGIDADRKLVFEKIQISRILRCMFVLENGERFEHLVPSLQEIIRVWENYI